MTWRAVNFWTKKLTEVLIRSFPKTEVSSVMQIETQELKNKVSKTQGPEEHLTQKYKRKFLVVKPRVEAFLHCLE
jgi:hypothetical protein